MRAIAFVDLDDTLFQTMRKCPPDVASEALVALGFARDGAPLSFATPRQVQFLEWLAETTRLIPVTARSLDALRRARVPHAAAICAHGGVILDEAGHVDRGWARMIEAQAERHAPTLELYRSAINTAAARAGAPIVARVLREGGAGLYVVAKHEAGDGEALSALAAAAVPTLPVGWTRHHNGNNLALLPPYLGKAQAVAHLLPGLRARFPKAPVIGIGDSLTDAPFMALCDYAMLPRATQLSARLFGDG
jgi:hydroxymethylpyrimidine pyrophosphatase-like HAD family hydrolase